MATRPTPTVIEWLLASDPSIQWQTLRDLASAPPSEWQAIRCQLATRDGWCRQLLLHRDRDTGTWARGAFVPLGFSQQDWRAEGQPWTATSHAVTQLRHCGLETLDPVAVDCLWEEGGNMFWAGEVEECINGRLLADAAHFRLVEAGPLLERLLADQQPDGGWNCERASGSRCSSFASTINVLEGLLEVEKAGRGTSVSVKARREGEEYLLQRNLFLRKSTGEPADDKFLDFLFPCRWHYDVLRALDYFREASRLDGTAPDARLRQAIEILRSKQGGDGKWALDRELPGRVWFKMNEGVGRPCPWITLRCLRVLKWWNDAQL
ncbi:hypothetical protein BC830DRAFT_1159348 [Chytriomyces sp. MP71]|nr:hypothetical protein BC830DRAFT_1159348 [Chytriomyces sp. MP71]